MNKQNKNRINKEDKKPLEERLKSLIENVFEKINHNKDYSVDAESLLINCASALIGVSDTYKLYCNRTIERIGEEFASPSFLKNAFKGLYNHGKGAYKKIKNNSISNYRDIRYIRRFLEEDQKLINKESERYYNKKNTKDIIKEAITLANKELEEYNDSNDAWSDQKEWETYGSHNWSTNGDD